jgi:hypothetical protein
MPFPLTLLYWGPEYDGHCTEEALSKYRFQSAVRVEQLKDIEKRVAEIVSRAHFLIHLTKNLSTNICMSWFSVKWRVAVSGWLEFRRCAAGVFKA